MLGNIIGVEENVVLLQLLIDLDKQSNLINLHVIMEDGEEKLIGEITDIKNKVAYVNLLGEIKGEKFTFGVIRKPSFGSVVKLVSKEKMPLILGTVNANEKEHLYIGKSAIYNDLPVYVGINDFFTGHFAIFGSTGSGKSCSIARIFQNLFEKKISIPYRSSIFIFDAYGEYHQAFKDLNKKVPEINMKAYTTNTKFSESEVLKIPLWFLGVDDIALLLGAENHTQLPIIEKALSLVAIFSREEENVLTHKNDIIARAILEILTSGRQPVQIRDQVLSILTYYNTKDLNLETKIIQPGYVRSLKQCLLIDGSGKMREMELVTSFMDSFLSNDLEFILPDGSFPYTLKDLKDAFDFALISEGVLKSDKIYDEANVLKVRLNTLINGESSVYFNYPEYVTKEQYIRDLLTAHNGGKAQIVNFNINF